MSTNPLTGYQNKPISNEQLKADYHYLIADHMPEAHFYVGGALRFDSLLISMQSYLRTHVKVRQLDGFFGGMPCLWSLDWHRNTAGLEDVDYCRLLDIYAANKMGITLCFDNPFISDEMLTDAYGLGLVQEYLNRNKQQAASICVANDKLCDFLKAKCPQVRIIAHPNRIAVEMQKRDAALYNKLLSRYDQVGLHPADAVKTSLTAGIEAKERIFITLNDTCLRTCPVRRNHLQALANMRLQPFVNTHRMTEADLITKVGCKQLGNIMSQTGNLSRATMHQLYEQGYRHFVIQAQTLRSPYTVATDVLNSLFTTSPEHSHQVASIKANLLSTMSMPTRKLKSGMIPFRKLYKG